MRATAAATAGRQRPEGAGSSSERNGTEMMARMVGGGAMTARGPLARIATLAVAAIALLCVASAVQAAVAEAAAELEVTSSHKGSVRPGGTGQYTVSLHNVGDAPTSGPITIVDTLPPGLKATSATDPFGGFVWSCSISGGGQVVTCSGLGPVPFILPGSEACGLFGFPCPITIALEVHPDAAEGTFDNQVEACGGGAPACDTHSDPTLIAIPAPLGAGFGVAPINGDPDTTQVVPALPEQQRAFWAGTCERATAPAFGQPIAGGIGSRPSTVFAPSGGQLVSVPAPPVPAHCLDLGREAEYPCAGGFVSRPCPGTDLWAEVPSWRLAPSTQAGAHPDGTAMFHLARNQNSNADSIYVGEVDGATDNIVAELPAGFVGDPTALPKCTGAQFVVKPLQCPPESQIGVLRLRTQGSVTSNVGGVQIDLHPVYNLEPRQGNVAELGVSGLSAETATTARIVAKARTAGDFGVSTFVSQIPAVLPLISQQITLWGVPWAAANDHWRSVPGTDKLPHQGLAPADQVPYDPSWGAIRPFISNPTECSGGELETRLLLDSFQNPAAFDADGFPDLAEPSNWRGASSPAPAVTGCEKVPFDAGIEFEPTSRAADSATGLSVDLSVPQNDDPPAGVATDPDDETGAPAHWRSDDGLATSQLDRVVVTLPEGFSVNPAGAAGLEGCSDAQFGVTRADSNPMLFNNGDPFDKDGGADGAECPDGSKIGTVRATTPLLDEQLTGEVVLGQPKSTDPQSGEMFRLFLVLRNVERGLTAKVYGSAVADPASGRLTTTFDKNPRVPLEQMHLDLKGGDRGLLATPQRCGAAAWTSQFSPWSAAHGAGGQPVSDAGTLPVDANCGFGFSPTLRVGTSPRQGGGPGTLSFVLSREDGQQWLRGVSAKLPSGLLASLRGVPLCSNAQADAGSCPAGSRIGSVDAGAGAGLPYFLERKGDVFLTEGYKGAPYGLAVKVPVEAGPFRGALALSPIVVRQALHVDRRTAEVTAVSDPLPLIHHGIPLRARQVTVTVDRPGFVRNPTDCSAKQTGATIVSAEGTRADLSDRFQATGCARLPFKPKIRLALKGRKQRTTGKHPAIHAVVTQRAGQAGIERAQVRLPRSLALDPDNARALCEFADGTKPDLESHCPKGSIVGRARAVTPLLNRPLTGNVYFVKNVRTNARTGNQIRTLPMIVVALRGEIAINLRGTSSTTRDGRLVNTFDAVPDAPVSRFELKIAGGKRGIVTVTRTRRSRIDICSARQIAEADVDGHNGRRADQDIRVKTPCKKRGKRATGNTRARR